MNYIEQIRGFWRAHEEHSFTPTEVAVYFRLLEICNICQWKNPFKRNNSKIGADLGISFNTLKNARNRLRQTGLIDFETKNGSPNVLYTLSKFDNVTNKVDIEVTNEVANEVDVEVLPAKDKLNKTKQKELESSEEDSLSVASQADVPDIIDYKKFVDWFNSETKGVFGIVKYPIGEKRKASIRARVREKGKKLLYEAVKKACESDFLKGNSQSGFVATFDWIIKPANFDKILSDNYKNHSNGTNQRNSKTGNARPTSDELNAAVEIGLSLAEANKNG